MQVVTKKKHERVIRASGHLQTFGQADNDCPLAASKHMRVQPHSESAERRLPSLERASCKMRRIRRLHFCLWEGAGQARVERQAQLRDTGEGTSRRVGGGLLRAASLAAPAA